ncbi:ligase-associated DNA damage response endonuclease PdeM [Lacinutrix neustonica]|uniref:Ligase-associated DNA damage response endonuclease PdeM n=1 Tax=Lacinutrix neustonica TaxID=2980107 RepID=A0A9E8MWV5_9FLAO|nr:ligase-associated DNA damage response endonuclease PdeM [Lacinutrix neustonica]WAC02816.1 ligase-associated DNA damage response endonuclease PdeM [Lacinutrix neustonica]
MKLHTKDIIIKEEMLTLTNQRALFWRAQQALVLSDLHIGKSAHFRKSGIPISDQVLQKDLERLKALILHFNARQLIIVGDLFHAEVNSDIQTFKTWLLQFEGLELYLVIGNHDRVSNTIYEALNIKISNPALEILPFRFIHDKVKPVEAHFIISGHTHPGVVIRGKAKQSIKLPCYQVTNFQLILPAFSLFTGLNTKGGPNIVKIMLLQTPVFLKFNVLHALKENLQL